MRSEQRAIGHYASWRWFRDAWSHDREFGELDQVAQFAHMT